MSDEPVHDEMPARDAAPEAEVPLEEGPVQVRHEGSRLVYSARGIDMIAREEGSAFYTVLRDFPRYGYETGQKKHLTEPHDEQCLHTARDLAACL